jgi:outer membrane lipoprotein-sorting protein
MIDMKKVMLSIFIFSLVFGVSVGAEDKSEPNQPCKSEEKPSTQTENTEAVQIKIPPELDKLLDRIEKRGAALKSFQANMIFEQEQILVDTVTIRNGQIYYQTDKETVRFRIHFADWLQKDLEEEKSPSPVKFDEDFVFDGLWVTRRNERTKTIQRWEIAKKPRPKEDFRLGKGPFPLPFAIRKADVLKEFEVKLIKPDPNHQKETEHLLLKPKKESSYAEEYVSLELWVNRASAIPQKISYLSTDDEVTTVTWSRIITDKPVKDNLFELKPAGRGWTTEETPLEEPPDAEKKKDGS